MSNVQSLMPEEKKNSPQVPTKFRNYVTLPIVSKNITETLGSATRSKKFIAAITSAVNNNAQLQVCDFGSIVNAALLGEALNLSPSAQLGQFYLVPYKCKKIVDGEEKKVDMAQFQLGYKGYIQLAMRTGEYRKIIVVAVKEGELVRADIYNDEFKFKQIEDIKERNHAKTIGYYAKFELLNGFTKELYWTKEEMVYHADQYSAAFSEEATNGKYPKVSFKDFEEGNYPRQDAWKYSSFWYKNFDEMAKKTMLRQLISKWGIMSPEMQKAFESDMGVIKDVNEDEVNVDYIDNEPSSNYEGYNIHEEPEQEIVNEVTGEIEEEQETIDFESLQ